MSFIKDTLSIFKKRDLIFIEYYKELEDVYTFLFEKEKDLTWKAGQHGLFRITHEKMKNPIRPFSLASAPSENVIQITIGMKDTPSDFKQAMLGLEKGMTVCMSGPVGAFYLKENSPSILIAGGIGITPFRSMLKEIEANVDKGIEKIHLLYLDSAKSFVFQEELDAIAHHTSLTITYIHSRDALLDEVEQLATLFKNKGCYFIAGPTSMVDSTVKCLQQQDVSKRNIKKDAFYGYP